MLNFTRRQQEIINTSVEILLEQGLGSLSIKNISQCIGIKESSIYNHFENKQDIFTAIYSIYKDKISNLIYELSQYDGTYLEKLEKYYFAVCREIETNPKLLQLLLTEFYQQDKVLKEEYLSLISKIQLQVLESIVVGQEKGEIKDNLDVDFIIAIIWGSLRLLIRKKMIIPNYSTKEDSQSYWHSILDILSVK